ncbi:hypothetical protein FHR92_003334 [Fontibacillus solani]|uniref:Peptidase MA-like domain-containing protein n=1 Tax=Fontibacillus solani TaxID=1572857 RepID=A0A7W3XSS5_9BACL|nr:hypothetical protein [Fontibacillus solani]MBA9086854.1 hypothetical protein [Fontibacillus solani]
MFKRRRKLTIIAVTLSLFLIVLVLNYMLSPQPVNAMFVGFSDYEELSSEVYVEPSISDNTKNKILMDLEQSQEKVIEVFDVIEAHPTIIFVQSSDAIKRYAQNQTGQTYYMYWGNYIVIGPRGFNEDVIAHELVHAELRKKIGDIEKVPVWFNEGLATTVDSRYISDVNVVSNSLHEISERGTFYEPTRVLENYKIANNEVTRWYRIVGKSGLDTLIAGLNKGKSFNKLYKEIEAASIK